MAQFGHGCIADLKSYKPDEFYGKGVGIADVSNYDLLTYSRFDLNQRASQGCVAYSAAQRLWADMQIHGGRKPILASPMAWYWAARRKFFGSGPVFDMGCRPGDLMDVFKELGWSPWSKVEGLDAQGQERVETWDLAWVDRGPDLDAYQAMVDRQWVKDVRLNSYGSDIIIDVQVLIAREKRMVGAGIVIDETFATWKAAQGPWRRTREAIGRHMVSLAAFEPGVIFAIGSYGNGNAEGNVVALAADVVAEPENGPFTYMDIDWSHVPQ